MTGLGVPDACACGEDELGLPCGCCGSNGALTPEDKTNAAALPTLKYRVGRYQTFRETMLRRIPSTLALKDLTTRRDDDFAIALIDMWSYVGDVLTFYQERYANEAFLRTATQRESILRLAAMLDHRPSPGAAATAWLAFTADKEKQVTIPVGLRVQSVPGQDEKPQKFETLDTFVADAALNQVRVFAQPASHTAMKIGGTRGVLDPRTAATTLASLRPGDRLAMVTAAYDVLGSSGAVVKSNVVSVEEKEVVEVDDDPLESSITWSPPVSRSGAKMAKLVARFPVFGATLPKSFAKTIITGSGASAAYTFTKTDITYTETGTSLRLDGVYENIPTGARVLIAENGNVHERTVVSVSQTTAEGAYDGSVPSGATSVLTPVGLARTVTVLEFAASTTALSISNAENALVYLLDGPDVPFANKAYREAGASAPQVAGQTKLYVPLALLPDRPLGQAATASALAQPATAAPQPRELLTAGRRIILDDDSQSPILATIAKATPENVNQLPAKDHVALTLKEPLPRALDTASAYMLGNVARATHGETVKEEVLGDGNGTKTFQSFELAKSPVTFVSSPGSPGGVATTLKVSVDRIAWAETDTLLLAEPTDEAYVTRLQSDDTMKVEFGDGEQGSRLPTGRKNVTATYRVGLGKTGNVPAGALRTALDKPVGLKGVTNPAQASGGADSDTDESIREAAPSKVRTFSRIVSLRDFRDAALEYAGVTKAKATWGWRDAARTVFLTVGGDPDAPLSPETLKSLRADLDARRDATAHLVLQTYDEIPILLEVAVVTDPRYVAEDVVAAVTQALTDMMAYEARDFGESVNLSDVYATIQAVAGVVAARVDKLRYKRAADRISHKLPKRPVSPRIPIRGTELAAFADAATDLVVKRVPDLADPLAWEDDE